MAAPGRRQSALPPSTRLKSSRASLGMAPQNRRKSAMSAMNSTRGSRMSMGNSRLSSNFSKATDPRAIGTKTYTLYCKTTLRNYLERNDYPDDISSKTLSGPTRNEFKSIMTFLVRRIDPNFEFGPNFEEDVKTYLRLFGYPFGISKAALTAVGSPHTWPSLLAALVWLVEFLVYDEEKRKCENAAPSQLDALIDGMDGEEKVFYKFTSEAYLAFLGGDDNYAMLDQELNKTFQSKNDDVEQEIIRLEARNDALKMEAQKMKNTENEIHDLQSKRDSFHTDLEKFKKMIEQLRAHKNAQDTKLTEKIAEHEAKQTLIATLANEKVELEEAIEKQTFTPLEVQAMNHEKQMLQDALTRLGAQKEELQNEIWDQEKKTCQTLLKLEKRIKQYNESARALELLPTSAKNAHGVDYELKLLPHAKTANEMTSVDLTRTIKPGLVILKQKLQADIAEEQARARDVSDQLTAALESCKEQERRVKNLQERAAKSDEQLRKDKLTAQSGLESTLTSIENAELELHRMRAEQTRILEQSETNIHQLDNELLQQRQVQLAERETLLQEIHAMSEKVLDHKMQISQLLKDVLARVDSTRDNLTRAASSRTPGRRAMTPIVPKFRSRASD